MATAGDIPFLVDAIVSAEKSGTETLSYCTLFDLDEKGAKALLSEVLAEDVTGQELCTSAFHICEKGGLPVAAACSWVESADGRPSGVIKANLLLHFLGRERFLAAADRLKVVETIALSRTPGCLQFDCVHVDPSSRGQGWVRHLFDSHVERHRTSGCQFDAAEVILMGDNAIARRAYERAGFSAVRERIGKDPALRLLLPGTSRLLMTQQITSRHP